MKRLMPIFFLLVGLMYAQPAQAEDYEPAVTPSVTKINRVKPVARAMDKNVDGKVGAQEIVKEVAKDVEVKDVISDVTNAVNATKDFRTKGVDKLMVLLLLLGSIFKLLLSTIKVLGRNIAWFKTKEGKRVIKYSTLGLGAVAALTSNLAFGMSWMEAGLIFLSGPVAVAIHEYTKDSKDPPDVEGTKPA